MTNADNSFVHEDGNTMNKNIKKLFDLDIDEVSVVDRPANQHGLIAFAKNDGGTAEEVTVPEEIEVFDETGTAVDTDVLEHGDVVFDAEGNEFVFVADGADEESVDESADEEGVDKANPLAAWGIKTLKQGAKTPGLKGEATKKVGGAALWAGRNPNKAAAIGAGAGVAGLAGIGLAAGKKDDMSKSLGDSILEELSKAVTEHDREEIIAKAMNEVEIAKAQAAEALEYAEAVEDARITDAYIAKAADYNLPVDSSVLGPILKSVATVLSDEQLQVLDELFASVGDALYNEIGYMGDASNSSVLDTVNGMAAEFVGKADVSYEQAVAAMFASNPSAYDAYLAENGR